MNGVINRPGSSLGFDSYVDKAYKKFQTQTQELSNKINSISLRINATEVKPLGEIVVTIAKLKTQLRVVARCVEGVAIKHSKATNSATKISPRPKDFTPDIQKLNSMDFIYYSIREDFFPEKYCFQQQQRLVTAADVNHIAFTFVS